MEIRLRDLCDIVHREILPARAMRTLPTRFKNRVRSELNIRSFEEPLCVSLVSLQLLPPTAKRNRLLVLSSLYLAKRFRTCNSSGETPHSNRCKSFKSY